MPGSGFKVVVRGLGTTGAATPLYIIDGITDGDINALNPADIESIDVLKDAASAAIYGSRAANGVVLVTTKHGRAGKTSITYDGYVGWQNIYRMPDVLNAKEFAMIMNEARMMDGLPGYDFASMVPDWDKIQNGTWSGTNWLEEARVKNAPITNHAINIAGGNERSVYALGFSYTYQEGIIGKPVQPKYQRYTARLNADQVLIPAKGYELLKIGESINYTYSENNGIAIGDMWSNDVRNMLHASPFLPNYDEEGNFHYAIPWENREANPIGQMYYQNGNNLGQSHSLQANVYAILQPIKDLKFKTSFGYQFGSYSSRYYVPVYKLASNTFNDNDVVSQSMSHGGSYLWENTLNYILKPAKHSIDILLGQSIEKNGIGMDIGGSNVNSIFGDFEHAYLSNTPVISNRTTIYGGPWGKNSLASFFGRVNYDYDNKYMATAVLRADGSSIFARGHRWGYFPSVSAGWILTEEQFMKPLSSWLDYLKVRASWGQNGNQNIAGFQYLSTISFSGADYTFGFNTMFSYKNWTAALSGHASIGNWVYNNVASDTEMLADLWTNSFVSNRVSSAPKSMFTQAQYLSDYYLRDGSFLKLDNFTIGYTFPKLFNANSDRPGSLNIFATVQNIYTFTKYSGIDPEVYGGIDGTVYPRPRTYIIGVKFNL